MYRPCPLTNPGCWARLREPVDKKKSLHESWPLENSSEQEKAPAISETCAAGRGDGAGDRRCSGPSPVAGLDWRVLGGPRMWGMQNSWQVPEAEP